MTDFMGYPIPSVRKILRNMPDLGDYGLAPGVHYNAADYDAMEAGVIADGWNKVYVPACGNYYWDERLTNKRGLMLEGEHKSSSVFTFFHNDVGMFVTGEFANGGGLHRMSIAKGTTGNCTAFVYLQSNAAGYAPDFFEIDGCNFTGSIGGTASYGLLLDGNPRDGTQENGLAGLRNVRITDTDVFNGSAMTIEVRHCKALQMARTNVFKGNGSIQKMQITGATSDKKSTNVHIAHCSMNTLIIDRARVVVAPDNYFENVTLTANAESCRVGFAFGTVSNSSPTSSITT